MLAKTAPKWLLTVCFAAGLIVPSLAFCQSQPSNQATPVSPPNVHVPVNTQRLPASNHSAEFKLSDTSDQTIRQDRLNSNPIQQTSFVQDKVDQPAVPDILKGKQKLLPESQAAQISRQNARGDLVTPAAKKSTQAPTMLPPPAAAPKLSPNLVIQEENKGPVAGPRPAGSPLIANGEEFNRQVNENRLGTIPETEPNHPQTKQDSMRPATMLPSTVAESSKVNPTSFSDSRLPNEGNSTPIKAKESSLIEMKAPAIEIQAFGPPTVGVHKRAQYKVVISNRTQTDAENLAVSVSIPQWIKMENISTSIGRNEAANEQRSQRVNWTIDRLSAGSSQTMVIDTIPSKAEHFDFVVDWTMQTRTASSKINVTEPRLEMNIAGPNEVMYGETAMYQVTVRNPGTGIAESVSVMLPEALGGERAPLGEIAPGQEQTFQVELLARAAGQLDLTTIATGSGDLQTNATRSIIVRRPTLELTLVGPPLKYSGSVGQFDVTITNTGDAIAREVSAALALPPGVQYIDGIEGAEVMNNAMRWAIGTLDVGDTRTYRVNCQLNGEGQMQLELGARGSSDIAGIAQCTTRVETVADLILNVEDPKGPLPTGQKLTYEIQIKNRGSRAAKNLTLVMQYSEGIEPTSAVGLTNQVVPGQVIFSPIQAIEPGEELVLQVTAQALSAGTHRFRAQLSNDESSVHEVDEGTTQFYGDNIAPTKSAQRPEGSSEFKR